MNDQRKISAIPPAVKIAALLLAIIWTMLSTGCIYEQEVAQLQQDHREFRTRLDSLDRQAKKLDQLEARLDTLIVLLGGNVGDHFASQEEILRGMRADQRSINREIETLIQTLASRVSDSDMHTRRLVQKLDEVNRLVTEIISNRDSTLIPHTFDVNDPMKLYEQSYLDFSRGETELARMGFQQYLELYPNTSLADNALYWVGESYLVENQPDSALAAFTRLDALHPDSPKNGAALLKRALILAARGEPDESGKLLEKLLRTFPGTPEANQATMKLEELKEHR